MFIREVRHDDADALARLAHDLGQTEDANCFSRYIVAYAPGFYVAESDAGVSGYLITRVEGWPTCVRGNSPVQLWRIFVSPELHGSGIAGGLMAQALTHARDNGHDVVWLGTSEDNARAIAFYLKNSFAVVGKATLHQGHDSHNDLILSQST